MSDNPKDELRSLLNRSSHVVSIASAYLALASGNVGIGAMASIPTLSALRRCAADLRLLAVSNLYTLFDRQGVNCLPLLLAFNDLKIADILENYIKPTWAAYENKTIRIRGNIGHHAPVHLKGKTHALVLLAEVPVSDVMALCLAINRAAESALARLGEAGLPSYETSDAVVGPIGTAAKDFADISSRLKSLDAPGLPKGTPMAGFTPLIFALKHNTVGIPVRIFARVLRSFYTDRAKLAFAKNRHLLPPDFVHLRDQFESTNSIFLTYHSYLLKEIEVGTHSNCHSERMRKEVTHALLLTWYSHMHTLFEKERISLVSLWSSLSDLIPPYSKAIFLKYIQPEWALHRHRFVRLRNEVGFHREKSDHLAERTHAEFLLGVPAEATTFLMRMLFLFFWSIDIAQFGESELVTIPNFAPPDAIHPLHRLSIDREFVHNRGYEW